MRIIEERELRERIGEEQALVAVERVFRALAVVDWKELGSAG